jgi:hypothetical protein
MPCHPLLGGDACPVNGECAILKRFLTRAVAAHQVSGHDEVSGSPDLLPWQRTINAAGSYYQP